MPTIRESMSTEVINAINSAYYLLCDSLDPNKRNPHWSFCFCQKDIEKMIWWQYLNLPLEDFESRDRYKIVFRDYMKDRSSMWYQKLDLLEFVIRTS